MSAEDKIDIMLKQKDEPFITIKGEIFEQLRVGEEDNPFLSIFESDEYPVKVKYWLGRVMEVIRREAKTYFKSRQGIIDEMAEKYGKDGERVNSDGETVKYSAEDPKILLSGMIDFGRNVSKSNEAFESLREAEIELPIRKIPMLLSALAKRTPQEFAFLFPFVSIYDEDQLLPESHKEEKGEEQQSSE